MSEDEKIHVDVSRPATLHNGAVSTPISRRYETRSLLGTGSDPSKLRERP
jgi:hypothetical protein